MPDNNNLETLKRIMQEFAESTGLDATDSTPRRYLWTDAFAVCNFLELYQQTNDFYYRKMATRLIAEVHQVLGHHRSDDSRSGWISGRDEITGQEHPTACGLRIGKPLPELHPDEIPDAQEWERDGQYFHYLTQWMHALLCSACTNGRDEELRWAIELAKVAHAKFVYETPQGSYKRIYWKMSIDLTYPVVRSMGQHDALDGLITYLSLQVAARRDDGGEKLKEEINDFSQILKQQILLTTDPLGLGGLLTASYRASLLLLRQALPYPRLIQRLLGSSLTCVGATVGQIIDLPASQRIAFRELGLCIGFHAAEKLQELTGEYEIIASIAGDYINELQPFFSLTREIEEFWLEPSSQQTLQWQEHVEINSVMLATALAPSTYLSL